MSVANKIKRDCCGCNACVEICPKHCIAMRPDRSGFRYARVDTARCVECGLCEKVCPLPAHAEDCRQPAQALASWARDSSIHRASSSGGIAYMLADRTLRHGGIVYGCAANGLDVSHIRITSPSELPLLRNSKYVQSRIDGIFRLVADDLRAGKNVAFFGTPCQVAALRRFIPEKISERLLLVDLICHGVPSQKMVSDYLRPYIKGHRVTALSFRNGLDYCLRAESNGTILFEGHFDWQSRRDNFLRNFLRGTILRPSCYACPYASERRASDITLGDFWGLRDPESLPAERTDGVSLILANTAKGSGAINRTSASLFVQERPLEEAVKGNARLRHPIRPTASSRLFSLLYPLLPFRAALFLANIPPRCRRLIRRLSPHKKDR